MPRFGLAHYEAIERGGTVHVDGEFVDSHARLDELGGVERPDDPKPVEEPKPKATKKAE